MSIDDLLEDLLELLLSDKEINLGLEEILGILPVDISKILRKDLVEIKSSESGLNDTCDNISAGSLL